MGSKGNFTQALRELTGFEESPEKAKQKIDINQSEVEQTDFDITNADLKPTYTFTEPEIVFDEREADTHVTSTMVIKGKVRSTSNLLIEGSIYGNIVTSENISVNNIVFGDMKAKNVNMSNAKVKGNIKCDKQTAVGANTVVIGDIEADTIFVSGKIKGDLTASDTTVLEEGAVVSGNIVTGNIMSNSGAAIKGAITTTRNAQIDDDTEFDLGVEAYE